MFTIHFTCLISFSHTLILHVSSSSSAPPSPPAPHPQQTSSENRELGNWDLQTSRGLVTVQANHLSELERLASLSNSYKGIRQ